MILIRKFNIVHTRALKDSFLWPNLHISLEMKLRLNTFT